MICVFCTQVPGRRWPGLSSTCLYSQVLNRGVGTNIHSNTHNFLNECFCCILTICIMIDTPVQASTNVFCRRPDSKYFSPLGVIWSLLRVFNSATVQWNLLQTTLRQKEHGNVPAKLNLPKQEAGWIWPTIIVCQPWPMGGQTSFRTWRQTNCTFQVTHYSFSLIDVQYQKWTKILKIYYL